MNFIYFLEKKLYKVCNWQVFWDFILQIYIKYP